MSEPSKLAKHLARTEGRYFLVLLFATLSLMAFNLHPLYKEWPSFMLQIEVGAFKEHTAEIFDIECRKISTPKMCDLEHKAYIEADLLEDYQNLKAEKENAEKNFYTRADIIRGFSPLLNKETLLSLCSEKYFSDMFEQEKIAMCDCYVEQGVPVFQEHYPVWVKTLDTQSFETRQTEIVKICTQTLKK